MDNWIKCSDKMPESTQRVLAYYQERGKNRIELACYIHHRTVKAEDYFSEESAGCEDYDELTDTVWVDAGWYEDSWVADTNWRLDENITHWMPLPQCPVVQGEDRRCQMKKDG